MYEFLFAFGPSVEKDGSPVCDDKQTIQTSLFTLLKDFLKSPTQEELHCVLAYILSAGEETQVCFVLFFLSNVAIIWPFQDNISNS